MRTQRSTAAVAALESDPQVTPLTTTFNVIHQIMTQYVPFRKDFQTEADAQTAERRTVVDTLAEVKRHLILACGGVAADFKAAQSAAGVKDPIAQVWIERLLQKAAEMRATAGDASRADDQTIPRTPLAMQQVLEDWLNAQPGDHMHPLLRWAGGLTPMLYERGDSQDRQASTRIRTPPSRFYTPFCLA